MSGCRAVSRQIIDNKRKRLTTAAAAAAAAVDVGGLTGLFLSLSLRQCGQQQHVVTIIKI